MENPSVKGVNQKNLADDIWFEIFLHFSLTAIFKLRCVSKLWFSILNSHDFIKKWYKLNSSLLPWSVAHAYSQEYLNPWDLQAYPDLHSRFISDHRYGFSFRFLLDHVVDGTIYLLGASNGLVLCTTTLYHQMTYYVCNPLTQKWVLLPQPPPPSENNQLLTGFVCDECFSESASYKVIRIRKFEAATKEFKVEIFSSILGEWNVYDVPFARNITSPFLCVDKYITHDGLFYWLPYLSNNLLVFGVSRNINHGISGNECSLIRIPDDENKSNRCLGESEGLLCYARYKWEDNSLSVWVLDGDWYILHKDIQLQDWLAEIDSELSGETDGAYWMRGFDVVGFSPVDKNVVIFSAGDYVWSYNIKTRVYEELRRLYFLHSGLSYVSHMDTLAFVLKPWPTTLPPVME